jgi:two-component system, chemotaxis family, protein-glutamate methylesterase/glutaminase
MKKIRVLVVDDSPAVCDILSRKLSSYPGITAEGLSGYPYTVRQRIRPGDFDVIVLDMDMPGTDGLRVLAYIMKYNPVPVIVMSSLVTPDNQTVVQALELGAVDAVHKPGGPFSVEESVGELCRKIREAAGVSVWRLSTASRRLYRFEGDTGTVPCMLQQNTVSDRLVVVGASTGGVMALEKLFGRFTTGFPPVLAVIRMPVYFTAPLAKRLDKMCEPRVKEAQNGEKIVSGTIYIAPGGSRMKVTASDGVRILSITCGTGLSGKRHPVDALFASAAETDGKKCTAVLLTGTGCDGARGMKAVRDSGGYTIAQDEESCIVYDMPAKAVALGAVCEVAPLDKIADAIAIRNCVIN